MALVWPLMGPCPFCGSTDRQEHDGRLTAHCPGCGSLERHRAVVRQLGDELLPRGSGTCLEQAPRSPQVYGAYLRSRGWRYSAVDRWDLRRHADPAAFGTFITHDADATDLRFAPAESYELFISQHVIEEVIDYLAALDEVSRVLEPGGRALLEIPFEQDIARSVRQPPDRYQNVWTFGRDLVDRLRARFDAVEGVSISEDQYAGTIFICRRS